VLGITAAVGIFPITLIILLKQYALLKKYGASAAQLDQQIQYNDAKKIGKASTLITVYGESQRESVSFPLDDFRFISAADNYIKLHFIKDNKLANEVLRNSLKKLSEQFLQYEQVFRCHRTYIVNLSAVNQVTGNAQGYKLHLKGVDESVPVSRNLNKELTTRLKTVMKSYN
jgi:DNA-binding LytR/AlgR family response regulator